MTSPVEDPAFHKAVLIKLDKDVLTEGISQEGVDMVEKYYGSLEEMARHFLLDHYTAIVETENMGGILGLLPDKFDSHVTERMAMGIYELIEDIFDPGNDNGREVDINAEAYSNALYKESDTLFECMNGVKNNIYKCIDLRDTLMSELGRADSYGDIEMEVTNSFNPLDQHIVIEYTAYKPL